MRRRSRSRSLSYSPSRSPFESSSDSEESVEKERRRSRSPPTHRVTRRHSRSRSRSPRRRRYVSRSRSPRPYKKTYSPQRRRNYDDDKHTTIRVSRDSRRTSSSPEIILKYDRSDIKPKKEESPPPIKKEKPNYGLSGNLAVEANTVQGVVLKYSEPMETHLPSLQWRLYVFKGEEQIGKQNPSRKTILLMKLMVVFFSDLLHVHKQTAYTFGREKSAVDILIEHPSCSKQHAVLQYRLVGANTETQNSTRTVKPYIIDLESTNGTFLNGKQIESSRYYELRTGDLLKFGSSTREYVLLSTDDA
jgi:smad nuclear-interacting protein 1